MKVLLIWEEIPERTKLYSLEGELAELAIASAGYFVNAESNAAVEKLSDELATIEPLGHADCHEAFDISGHDKVVIAGFIM
jgi:hypothetical protein